MRTKKEKIIKNMSVERQTKRVSEAGERKARKRCWGGRRWEPRKFEKRK